MSRSLSNDRELIQGCLEGNKRAWDLFVDRFANLVYWSIQKVLENGRFAARKDLSDDIFQEVFQRLVEKEGLSKLRQVERLRPFLVVIATHAALDKVKHLTRQETKTLPLEEEFLEADVNAPTTKVITGERDGLISEALDRLSPKERACVEWHYMDGRTHQEIARILGLSTDTVSSILRRTRQKLEESFGHRGLK